MIPTYWGRVLLSLQPYHSALVIELKATAKGPLAIALHGGLPALKAPHFAVIVWHTGRVTKHPIALLVLSAAADPEGLLGQQQIVFKIMRWPLSLNTCEQASGVIYPTK